ncbi:DUF1028 domain-containing protein [Salimicrobium salexigens]|uniref:Uncharacterized conserved protein, Ntn-hydrolase superfamily n=1 Tax=Salimicrobium salexigens TaxID=908941 RepID=A0ABY1KTM1_9BACI|nr:DUF1028 domain-containing protein [Salimicrobium salexigens]SIS75471.1 Uncharacterized conserved protein, Ntn-hydrolase superfamily [Salimicrobium salexigens]
MTFSITAKCKETGQFGVAVSTKVPAVGALCPFTAPKAGAVATQSFVNPYIGINGVRYLNEGFSAEKVKEKVLKEDAQPAIRQFCIVDKDGNSAAFSGDECEGWYGHREGDHFAVAGSMLTGPETIQAMYDSFLETEGTPLSERLVIALQAGQDEGGDKRGRQSAAVRVSDTEEYPLVDLRVDEHPDPVKELYRIHQVAEEELFPFVGDLPTKDNPKGNFDS